MGTCLSVRSELPSISFLGSPHSLKLRANRSLKWPYRLHLYWAWGEGDGIAVFPLVFQLKGKQVYTWADSNQRMWGKRRNKWKYRKKHLVSGSESWEILFEYQGIFAASFYSMFLTIHSRMRVAGPGHRSPPCLSFPPSHIQGATSAKMPQWSARGPAELSCPAPRKCQGGPSSCSGGAQPPSPLHTWLCSTTSLWGPQQQPSPDSRGVQDIKEEEQASDQPVVCKCHHTDIYQNAAGRGIAGSAPTLF